MKDEPQLPNVMRKSPLYRLRSDSREGRVASGSRFIALDKHENIQFHDDVFASGRLWTREGIHESNQVSTSEKPVRMGHPSKLDRNDAIPFTFPEDLFPSE